MNIETIEVKKLSKSPHNVRRTGSKAACEEMKASLLAHGLMQNLVVVAGKKGKYQVIAGARRLEALQALVAEGKLPDDHAVPCQVVTADEAEEMSLAENTVRQAMHPADEFEAFVALVDKGQTAVQIAERFGVGEKHVLQRLKLGRVAPELLVEYRAGNIKLESLEAFTVTDDREKQLAVYRGLNSWQQDNPRHIRAALTEQMTEADDKLAKFVGLDAYAAAGGRTRTDLFGEDVYLEDTAILQRLAGEKLEAEAERLRADGWGWVEVGFECGYGTLSKCGRLVPVPLDAPAELTEKLDRLEAEQREVAERLDAIDEDDGDYEALSERAAEIEDELVDLEDLLKEHSDFLPEQKELAGCFVSVEYNGKLCVERGLVKPEDKKEVAKARPAGGEPDDAEDDKPGLPQSLIDDLKAYRTQVAQVALAMSPALAFDLLVMSAARQVLGKRANFDGADILFRESHVRPSGGEDTLAAKRLEAIREDLPLSWMRERTEVAQLAAFQGLDDADKLRILAYCTAMTLRPKLAPAIGKQQTVYDAALAQTGADVAGYWRPTAANFLGRIKVSQLLEIGTAAFGPTFASRWGKAKKGELVAVLDRGFSKPEQDERPDVRERLEGWLPEGMALAAPKRETDQAEAA